MRTSVSTPAKPRSGTQLGVSHLFFVRFRRRIWRRARPAPSARTGLTKVVSTATYTPPHIRPQPRPAPAHRSGRPCRSRPPRLLPLRACPPASTLQPSPCWSPSKAPSPAGSLRSFRQCPNFPPTIVPDGLAPSCHCRCHRRLDPLGDHRAACSTSGILRSGLERAAARVCREAGAPVISNTRLKSSPTVSRCGAAPSSPLTRALPGFGRPRRRGGRTRGAALVEARLRKGRVYPELLRAHRCRLVRPEDGGARKLRLSSASSLELGPFLSAPPRLRCSLVGVPVQLFFDESLLEGRVSAGGPDLSELLADSACPPPLIIRLR